MVKRDIILTGLPRGGTTLVCHLLNKLPNVIALHEPMKAYEWGDLGGHAAVADAIQSFFQEMRTSINTRGRAISKHTDGKVPDNPWGAYSADRHLRMELVSRGEIAIEKDVSPDFLLIIKHASEFTAILETLIGRFPAYAIVRNPLSVLASWNTVDFPVNAGRSHSAELLDSRLREDLDRIEDKTARQLHLLSWLFEAYHRLLPPDSVLRYEDIVESKGKALRIITPLAEALNEPLLSKNQNKLYSRESMRMLAERLLASDGPYWNFYSRESVESLLDEGKRRQSVKQAIAGTTPVVITGMHRSGTSMVANLLHDCGLYLGHEDDLLPATPHNQEGHWEHRKFVALSDEFLTALSAGWDWPPEVPEDWSSQDAFQDTRMTAATLLEEFAGHSMWGWKDPRVCLTLPLWKELLPEFKVVVCLRNPLEVAHSLRRRGSMSSALSLRLWCAYNERLLEATHPKQRLITHYEAYFLDPKAELRRVLQFLRLPVAEALVDSVAARVQSKLRHHRFLTKQLGDTAIEGAALNLYAQMCVEAGWREDDPVGPLTAALKRLSVLQYQALVRRIQAVASRALPDIATVIVVSKGDDALLQLNGCRAWHFPQNAQGVYAGHAPADAAEVLENLEHLCAQGGDHLLFPQTAFWWLDYYDGLRQYLETRCRRVWADGDCMIYRFAAAKV